MKKIFCIIPARGGSKGIKNKNIKLIKKKYLINYTIEFAKKNLKNACILVSSDSEKILKISRKNKGVYTSKRPARLSSDDSLTYDVVIYELLNFEKKYGLKFDLILLLQPTCPFRSVKDYKKIFSLISKKEVDSVVSVCEVGAFHPERMKVFKGKYLKNFTKNKSENMKPRQSLNKVYIRSGSYYLIKRSAFFKYKRLVGKKCAGIIVKDKYKINIDDKNDLIIAQNL